MNKQKIKGRMAVYSSEHKLIEQRLYYTSGGMRRIMHEWMDDYPAGHYITVRPYEEQDQPKEVYRLHIPLTGDVPQKIVRPPAVYNNKSYV